MGPIGFREMGLTFFKTTAAAVIMGIVVHYLYPFIHLFLGTSMVVALLLDILCGIIIYGLIIIFMKIKEVDYIINYLKRHFIKRKV